MFKSCWEQIHNNILKVRSISPCRHIGTPHTSQSSAVCLSWLTLHNSECRRGRHRPPAGVLPLLTQLSLLQIQSSSGKCLWTQAADRSPSTPAQLPGSSGQCQCTAAAPVCIRRWQQRAGCGRAPEDSPPAHLTLAYQSFMQRKEQQCRVVS